MMFHLFWPKKVWLPRIMRAGLMRLAKTELKQKLISSGYEEDRKGIFRFGHEGYWPNLTKEDNRKFIDALEVLEPRVDVCQVIPQFEDIIYSPFREGEIIESKGLTQVEAAKDIDGDSLLRCSDSGMCR